ncbi:hypothetical protein OIU84_000399 [Salix udensis]|uniref:PARP catalytic domain-containing protein n=1 Tax=Salix udensis TaxID=889485 RepID=A0AAD6L4R8_9ROSI|nr:hypothetical protein OIU84_000399 [Salix udensis]
MQARFNAFKSCVHAVRERRRDRNFKYGWYGASKQEILHIISYGFSRCNGQSHGVGVYLSTSKFILEMFPSTIEDENGLRHTLFCYVEMGKMELIRAGSKQIYPSSVDFDSGVDNLEDPSRLVVWSAYMNSFILPICILSFKAPSLSIVSLREQINEVRPGGEMLSCAALFPNLVKVFGPAKWDMICKSLDDYRKCKINRVQMIQSLKRIIGSDPMLMSVLKAIRDKLAQTKHGSPTSFSEKKEDLFHWDDLYHLCVLKPDKEKHQQGSCGGSSGGGTAATGLQVCTSIWLVNSP